MITWLLDGKMLLALTLVTHPHHQRADKWLARESDARIATYPVTVGTLLRLHMMHAVDTSAAAAWSRLKKLHAHPRHVFWPDNFSYTEIDHTRLTGHRHLTGEVGAVKAAG